MESRRAGTEGSALHSRFKQDTTANGYLTARVADPVASAADESEVLWVNETEFGPPVLGTGSCWEPRASTDPREKLVARGRWVPQDHRKLIAAARKMVGA